MSLDSLIMIGGDDMAVLTTNTKIKPMNSSDKKAVKEAFKTEHTMSQSAILKFKKNSLRTKEISIKVL